MVVKKVFLLKLVADRAGQHEDTHKVGQIQTKNRGNYGGTR